MIRFKHSFAKGEHTVGPTTYIEDFKNIIEPHLAKTETGHNVLVSTLLEVSAGQVVRQKIDKVVQVLHSMKYLDEPWLLGEFANHTAETLFITHYKAVAEKINADTPWRAVYIPMSIDTSRMPDAPVKHSGKMIYYGNLYPEKLEAFNWLQHGAITGCDCLANLDVLSFGRLNFNQHEYTHVEGLHKVGKYDVGFGVGRCALEMMAMGCKVVVLGENYAGVIDSQKAFEAGHQWNFNSRGDTAKPYPQDFMGIYQRAMDVSWKPNLAKIDMKTYLPQYKEAITCKQAENIKSLSY